MKIQKYLSLFFYLFVIKTIEAQTTTFDSAATTHNRLGPHMRHYVFVVIILIFLSLLGWYLFRIDKKISDKEN